MRLTIDKKKNEVVKHLLSEKIFGLQDDELKNVIETKLAPFMINYYHNKILK